MLLGQDAQNLNSQKFDKKIICDFDDFEMGEAVNKGTTAIAELKSQSPSKLQLYPIKNKADEHIDIIDEASYREQTKSPRVIKSQLSSSANKSK